MTETPNDQANTPEPGDDRSQPEVTGPRQDDAAAQQSTAEQHPQQPAAEQHATQPTEQLPAPDATQRAEQQPPAPQYSASRYQAPQASAAQTSAPNYGNGSFGQPPAGPNVAPYAASQTYAGERAYAAPGAAAPADPQKAAKRRNTGLIAASLAVGALIGGAAGGGIGAGVYAASQGGNAHVVTSSGPSNITVNNTKSATVVTAVAAKASPSVVTISVTGSQEGGTGSGIVLSKDGYVLTNTHVVTLDGQESNVKVQVQDNNGKLYSAKVVATDPIVDLAVIKLDGASDMKPATFADSSKLNVGDTAVAIGAPLGLSGTVTDGIVSALDRSISIASSAAPNSSSQDGSGNNQGQGPNDLWNFDFPGQGGNGNSQAQTANNTISLPVIQTDAAINPGNSGGALLNDKGQVIGVNVAIASASSSSSTSGQSGSIGVGFAIPSNLAQRVAGELINNQKGSHGLLGATVQDASGSGSSNTVGALIHSVTSGGAAADAGLKAGDIVTNFNGRPITSSTDLTAQVRFLAGGSKASLTYVRDGKTYSASVTLGTLAQ